MPLRPAPWRGKPNAKGWPAGRHCSTRYPDHPKPTTHDCCQYCCQAAGQRPPRVDSCGMSASARTALDDSRQPAHSYGSDAPPRQACARCVPDRPVNAGNSRSLPDSRHVGSPAYRQADPLVNRPTRSSGGLGGVPLEMRGSSGSLRPGAAGDVTIGRCVPRVARVVVGQRPWQGRSRPASCCRGTG
jgi:hypothetical protein